MQDGMQREKNTRSFIILVFRKKIKKKKEILI